MRDEKERKEELVSGFCFFFSSRRRHTRLQGDWSSDVCSSDLTRLPTCAHEPTSAWLSIMVPWSTYAPTFTYIGGMQTTPGATYAPSRMLDPPGTMRTPSASVVGRTG